MAIIQISKLQQRSGNLVDLPQLDEGEFGWATDTNRLFIGKTTPNENIEVLTSYSDISFSQINGSGNTELNISNTANGQILGLEVVGSNTYVINKGGTLGGLIDLGDVANVKISGGAIGYVLETDSLGNLSWTPKGTLYTAIEDLSNATPIIMTVDPSTPYTNTTKITISGVNGTSNSIVNSNTFYLKLAVDYPTSGNVELYTDISLSTAAVGTGLTYTNSPNAIATTSLGGSGGTVAAGSSQTVQFNVGSLLAGDADFTFNNTGTKLLTVNGNISTGNINQTGTSTASRFISNVATGTAPFTVTSTTQVANLNVATAGTATTAGTVTTAAQPNITSVGTLTSLTVTGNVISGNVYANSGIIGATRLTASANVTASQLISNVSTGTAPLIVTSTTQVANLNVATAGTVTTAAQPNITSVGTLTSLGVNGTITGVNITANTGVFTGNANGLSSIQGSNLTGTINSTVLGNSSLYIGTTQIALNRGSAVQSLTGITSIDGYASTVSTAAQPNITSVSSSFTSLTFANAQTLTGNNFTLSTGANTNTGTIVGDWTLSTGSKLQATYADLAEYYEADQEYEPGTVLEFGGDKEVTIAEDGTTRVAGVVTTNPAYVMNTECPGIAVAIALQGRVPCKVRGKIRKGDIMVSAGDGFARPWQNAQIGMIIGKSIENFEGAEGVIEIAVGRL